MPGNTPTAAAAPPLLPVLLTAEALAALAEVRSDAAGGLKILPLLLPLEDVAALLKVRPRTFARMVAAGDFPAADVRRGRKFVRWRLTTVLAGVEQLAGTGAAGR